MTAFRKLFIAALLIATGLGVAVFLGEPDSIKQVFNSKGMTGMAPAASVGQARSAPPTLWASNSVQLLPDPVVKSSLSAPEAPPLAPIPSTPIAAADSHPAQTVAFNEPSPFPSGGSDRPRAKLRNEAPRPIGNEPRSPATIRRGPPVESANAPAAGGDDAYKVSNYWPVTQVMAAGFSNDTNSPAASTAVYDVLASNPSVSNDANRQASAPAWPAEEEVIEPTTHLIVDGDSLEKLAGRYLDDPHRGKEIFELNREVLSNPELLPIGAELKLPNREALTSWDRQSRRVGYPNDASVREAAMGNLVPIRPMSSWDAVIPQAKLTGPVSAQ